MRLALFATCLTAATGLASISARADDSSGKSEHSTGRTQTPETLGQKQPQGWTGPTNTGSGGRAGRKPARSVAARNAASARRVFKDHRRPG